MVQNEQALRLRNLSNEEYDHATKLAGDTPLNHCPTCGAKPKPIPDSPGLTELVSGTYRYWGKEYRCDCETQIALRRHYLAANIGDQYMRLNWDDFNGVSDARDAVKDYLEKWKSYKIHGWGIEFGGPLGVGKTFAATHIAKELVKQGQRVYFVPFIEMVDAFSGNDRNNLEDRIRQSTYVILDEVVPAFSQAQAALYAVKFETVIRHRTNFNLPTIITTNMDPRALKKHYERTYSLLSAKQMRIDMMGVDVRMAKIPEENQELAANDEVRPIT